MTDDVKILPVAWIGEYRVELDGEQIGRVRKRRESYSGIRGSSGRRLGTYTHWDAYDLDSEADDTGRRIPGEKIVTRNTRRDAVAELVAYAKRQRELFG